ncbi:MAG: hypothetical protein LBB52_02170 [Desulfovibrio sp.]|jgi:transcription elongation factor Elf1|nr:hypothetical protein [Desulfovibrio sp.]
MERKPVKPVKPSGMDLTFHYICPHCRKKLSVNSPMLPAMVSCSVCGRDFPIVPVDQYTVHFIQLMLGDGQAAVDPDYL